VRIVNSETAISFDDVLLVPKYSDIASRTDVNTSVNFMGFSLLVPIVSSPMTSVFSLPLALELERLGGLAIIPRFITPNEVIDAMEKLKRRVPSVGVQEKDKEIAVVYKNFTSAICIDTANGFRPQVVEMANYLRAIGYKEILCGNVATHDGAQYLARNRITSIRVGIGNGHACITRKISGHGIPQLQAIADCSKKTGTQEFVTVADGGIRGPDDAVKAISAGASVVMIGKLFAETFEADNNNVYSGMASEDIQLRYRGAVGNGTAEGVSMPLKKTRSVEDVVNELVGGIRSGMSYSGAQTIKELQAKAEFIRISPASVAEGNWYA
jgi:IMP dehydrogenase